jgi:hypothetical protein
MVAFHFTMLALDNEAPNFRLPDASGEVVALAEFEGAPALRVNCICHHCPFVK